MFVCARARRKGQSVAFSAFWALSLTAFSHNEFGFFSGSSSLKEYKLGHC